MKCRKLPPGVNVKNSWPFIVVIHPLQNREDTVPTFTYPTCKIEEK